MVNIGWNTDQEKVVYFSNVPTNEAFVIDTCGSKGAIYVKTYLRHSSSKEYLMLELATGQLFPPTTSPVKRVKVDVKIHANKPDLYSKNQW